MEVGLWMHRQSLIDSVCINQHNRATSIGPMRCEMNAGTGFRYATFLTKSCDKHNHISE
jgi:hypothetical protein